MKKNLLIASAFIFAAALWGNGRNDDYDFETRSEFRDPFPEMAVEPAEWKDLYPFEHLDAQTFLNLMENTPGLCHDACTFGSRKADIFYLENEIEYNLDRICENGSRVVVVLTIPDVMVLDIMVADTSKDFDECVFNNRFAFGFQAYDFIGASYFVYVGQYQENIGVFPLEKYEIASGAFEESVDCLYSEPFFYFCEKNTGELMSFSIDGAKLVKSGKRMSGCDFYYDGQDDGSKFRDLYCVSKNKNKFYLCQEGKYNLKKN